MILLCLMAGIALALLCPETEIGRFARRHLVERPALWLNDPKPGRAVMWLLFIVAMMVLMTLFPPADLLPMIGEAPFYIDLTIAVIALASQASFKTIKAVAQRIVQGVRRLSLRVAHRAPRPRRPRLPRRSYDDHAAWGFA
jgi:hypothetical protein